jgi:hypothetical protein
VVDVSEVSILLAAVGVLFGVIYYVLDIGHQFKMRQMDLIMRLHLHACSKEFVEAYQKVESMKFSDYDDFVKKYGTLGAEGPEQNAFLIIVTFMEGIGVLLHRRLADIDTIRELFPVEDAWRKLGPIVLGSRKEQRPLKMSEAFKWFEYLYNETVKAGRR